MFEQNKEKKQITVLGRTFNSEDERLEYFRNELRRKLPELKQLEGFPIGEDEDIIDLSDPPYYTACPNPWLNDFIAQWETEKKLLEKEGIRNNVVKGRLPYTMNITESVNNEIYRAHSYHTKVPHPAICRLLLHYTQAGDIVLDSFAGTGMSGVATRKCDGQDRSLSSRFKTEFKEIIDVEIGSRRAILNDLSPIAFHISKSFNSNHDIDRIDKAVKEFKVSLINSMAHLFKTKINGQRIPINYLVWSEVIQCKNCSNDMIYHDLTSDYEKNSFTDKLICPSCNTIQKRTESTPLKETYFDSYLNQSIERLKYVPCHINYSHNKIRNRKYPDSEDIDLAYFDENNINDKFVPTDLIPNGDKSSDPYRVGVTHIHQFYSPRIRYFLKTYVSLINSTDYRQYKEILLFILTAILPKLTRMNRYMPKHGSRALVGPMANTLYIPPMYVENNPIDQFEFQSNKILKALSQNHSLNAGQIGSATLLNNIKNESIDYIFIDPPFGANIMYSELNQLSESWLRVKTNNIEEAIENKSQGKSKLDYQTLMHRSFSELYRLLKTGSYMTVQFSNTSAAVWNTIQNSIKLSGFIITNVITNDNTRGGLHAMIGPTAVKQNLIINCFKPSSITDEREKDDEAVTVLGIVQDILDHLPVSIIKDKSSVRIFERTHKIIYDKLLAYYVSQNLPVPIDSIKFRTLLENSFAERDGMFFTYEQVQEYDRKKSEAPDFVQLSIMVSSEQDGVYWLKNLLKDKSLTYQNIQPQWMQALDGVRKGDLIPELATILDENFLKDDEGKWYLPDPENEADLEKLRNKRLLKQFEVYKSQATAIRAKKIKEVRVDALRAGFKQCYQDKDFPSIVAVGDKIPNNLLMEDEVLLQFYDIASSRL